MRPSPAVDGRVAGLSCCLFRDLGDFDGIVTRARGMTGRVPDAREAVRGRGRILDREWGGGAGLQGHGKALRVRDTSCSKTPPREPSCTDPGEEAPIRDKIEIERRRSDGRDGQEALIDPLRDRSRSRSKAARTWSEGLHRRRRVRDRTGRRQGRRGVERWFWVRHLRHRDRAGPRRRADSRRLRLHPPDGERLTFRALAALARSRCRGRGARRL